MRRKRGKLSVKTTHRILKAAVIVVAVFDVLIWHYLLTDDAQAPVAQESINTVPEHVETSRSAPIQAVQDGVGVPVRIMIPSIALDAAVERVSLTKDGSMDVPKRPLDTGWYELGPRPGETGSAAIAGHVDWKNGATAVFADLHKVKSGDTISVQDDKGAVILFVVRESRRFDPAADAIDVFSSNDGKAHLNIITCAGAWDKSAKQYSKRLVVFADKAAE